MIWGHSGEADQKEQNKVCFEVAASGIIRLLLVTALVEAMGGDTSVRCWGGGGNTGSGGRSLGYVAPRQGVAQLRDSLRWSWTSEGDLTSQGWILDR